MRQLSRFLRLGRHDRNVLVESACALALIRLGLSLLSLEALLNLPMMVHRTRLDRRSGPQTPTSRIAWGVNLASRYVPATNNCLIRALAVQALLARRRQSAQLKIGVAKGLDGELRAHAWVVSNGNVVIGGSGVDVFIPLSAASRAL